MSIIGTCIIWTSRKNVQKILLHGRSQHGLQKKNKTSCGSHLSTILYQKVGIDQSIVSFCCQTKVYHMPHIRLLRSSGGCLRNLPSFLHKCHTLNRLNLDRLIKFKFWSLFNGKKYDIQRSANGALFWVSISAKFLKHEKWYNV